MRDVFRSARAWVEPWLRWLIVTGVSWFVSYLLASLVVALLGMNLSVEARLLLSGALGGGVLGLAQWFFLGLPVRSLGAWSLTSALGWLVGLTAAILINTLWPNFLGMVLSGLVGGYLLGVIQSLALARWAVSWLARHWTAANVAGWLLILPLGMLMVPAAMATDNWLVARSWVVGGLVLALVAALLMVTVFTAQEERNPRRRGRWWV